MSPLDLMFFCFFKANILIQINLFSNWISWYREGISRNKVVYDFPTFYWDQLIEEQLPEEFILK